MCFRRVGADTSSSSHWTSETPSHIGAEGAETVGNVYWEEAQVTDAMETKMRKIAIVFLKRRAGSNSQLVRSSALLAGDKQWAAKIYQPARFRISTGNQSRTWKTIYSACNIPWDDALGDWP